MNFFDKKHAPYPLTSVSDYRELAKKRLPRQLFDFIDGGAFDEVTMRRNQEDFQHIKLRKRVLKDVSNIDTRTEVLGQQLQQPLILAPVGFAGTYARRGEVQASRAAAKAGIPFSQSAVSICTMQEVLQATSTPFWYQFYLLKDKEMTCDWLDHIKEAGCPVLLLTVDLPGIGVRSRYNRSRRLSQFLDPLMHMRWFIDVRMRGKPLVLGDVVKRVPHLKGLPEQRQWMSSQFNPAISWKDIEWLRTKWAGKLVLKGILDPEDARMASEIGVDGIVVSNHGARHFDSTLSTISALPAIVEVVKDRTEVLFDGGINSGLDVVKAIALGANACMIGRAWAFGLAARGEQGVSEVINIIQHELKIAMSHLGITKIKEIDRSLFNICKTS